jgi:hypothetical protein
MTVTDTSARERELQGTLAEAVESPVTVDSTEFATVDEY